MYFNFDIFRKILHKSTVQTFHMSQQFLIVTAQNDAIHPEKLETFFGIVLAVGLLNVNVLIKNEDTNTWSLHFYKPFQRNCHSIDTHEIERFSLKNYTSPLNLSRSDLYPPKLFKFHNCPLKVATFPIQPFVIIQNAVGSTSSSYDGVDVIIVNQISKTLNLVPEYFQSTDRRQRGMVFENRTATGAIKMVQARV